MCVVCFISEFGSPHFMFYFPGVSVFLQTSQLHFSSQLNSISFYICTTFLLSISLLGDTYPVSLLLGICSNKDGSTNISELRCGVP